MAAFIEDSVRGPVCCSIFNRNSIVAFCAVLAFSAASALAQRSAGGPAHISAGPIYHSHTPSAPMFHSAIASSRSSSFRATSTIGSFRPFSPRRPIRPFPPVLFLDWSPFIFGGPFSGFNCWSVDCDLFWPGMFDYATISFPGPVNYISPAYEAPVVEYGDYGEEGPDMPQLYLKDGSVLNVTDYWVIDGQLHFTIVQEYGAEPTEEVIPFETMDLQKSVDVNTRRGFRFMLRNAPFEQYVHDHPEGPPPALTPQQR
jgi:hypothetical protein